MDKEGFDVRYRICSYLWSSMNLPENIVNLVKDEEVTHLYLEFLMNKKWVVLDATWDCGLKNIFEVNFWDGKSNTKIAVEPIKIFTLEESDRIIDKISEQDVLDDLNKNLDFKIAFNNWLNKERIK